MTDDTNKPPVPEKITIVIDPISKPLGLAKDIAKGIERGAKEIDKGFKKAGKEIKKAFTIKKTK